MRILVLGGTKFVGRHLVEAALARGHEVTLFNRGTSMNIFPELEHLKGDRNGDVEVLHGRAWDRALSADRTLNAGLEPYREAELLRRWHALES